MKLAWLCYDEEGTVTVTFTQPDRYYYYEKIVAIVYAEIVE